MELRFQATKIIDGNGPPAAATGDFGDIYFDNANHARYGPKAESGWGAAIPLRGPQGERGLTGERGVQGFVGERGPQGERGLQGGQGERGLAGVKGDKGDKGDIGVTGERGLQGLQGEKGDTGDDFRPDFTGLRADRGAHDAAPAGSSYLATDENLLYFRLASGGWGPGMPFGRGEKGERGLTGEQGIQGVEGERGQQGNQGAQGTAGRGFNPRGTWTSGATYAVDDLVTHDGATYRRRAAGAGTTSPPADTTNWELWAARGTQGIQGNQGVQGIQGPQGTTGATGPGLPAGGATGNVPRKRTATDHDIEWTNLDTIYPKGATAGAAADNLWVFDQTSGGWLPKSRAGAGVAERTTSHGTASPTNPVAGQLWLDTATNPPTLKAWSGSTWQVVRGGEAASMKVKGFAAVIKSGTQSVPRATWTKVIFNQVQQNALGWWDTATSQWVVAEAGIVGVSAGVRIALNSSGLVFLLSVYKNDEGNRRLVQAHTGSTDAAQGAGSTEFVVAAEDRLDVRIWHNAAAARDIDPGMSQDITTYFSASHSGTF